MTDDADVDVGNLDLRKYFGQVHPLHPKVIEGALVFRIPLPSLESHLVQGATGHLTPAVQDQNILVTEQA